MQSDSGCGRIAIGATSLWNFVFGICVISLSGTTILACSYHVDGSLGSLIDTVRQGIDKCVFGVVRTVETMPPRTAVLDFIREAYRFLVIPPMTSAPCHFAGVMKEAGHHVTSTRSQLATSRARIQGILLRGRLYNGHAMRDIITAMVFAPRHSLAPCGI